MRPLQSIPPGEEPLKNPLRLILSSGGAAYRRMPLARREAFDSPRPSIRRLRRLLRVRKKAFSICRDRKRNFFNNPSSVKIDPPQGALPLQAVSTGSTQFPAFALAGSQSRPVWRWRNLARTEPREFPKNSININKFTGFFGKLLNIFEGKCEKLRGIAGPKCAQMRGIARVKISFPQKHREDTTAKKTCARRQMRGNARLIGAPSGTPKFTHAPGSFYPVTC